MKEVSRIPCSLVLRRLLTVNPCLRLQRCDEANHAPVFGSSLPWRHALDHDAPVLLLFLEHFVEIRFPE